MRKFILALAAVIAAVHCNAGSALEGDTRAETFCEASCSCEGCTETDRGICVSDMGDVISDAETARCNDELDGYFSCLEKDAFCDGGTYDTSTCHTEENVLSQCTSGISGSSGTGVGGATAASSSVAAGTGGAGGGTGCTVCSDLIIGADPSALCIPSQTYFSSLLQCGCMSTTCQANCPNFCSGLAETSTCFTCLQTYCPTEFSACQGDI